MIRKPEQIVTDAEIDFVWGNANFGKTPRRKLIGDVVTDVSMGFSHGYTAMTICHKLGLVRKYPNRKGEIGLTRKGQQYFRALHIDRLKNWWKEPEPDPIFLCDDTPGSQAVS